MSNKFYNIKDRVLQIPENKGITKQKFFKKIGMSYGNFTGKSKETPLNSNAISNISSNFPDVNLNWLINGKGNMLLENDNITSEPAEVYKKPLVQEKESPQVVVLKEKIALLEKVIKDKEDIIKLQKDRIEKDCVQIDKLKQKVKRLKESLEKKNAYNKPVGAGTSLPSKSAANKSGIAQQKESTENPQRPYKSS